MSEIKDSGERREFETGAVRDMAEGKGRFDLLPMCVLLRLAKHYEKGLNKYGPRNWEKGIPASSFADSAFRHMVKYMDGWDDEDHLIAAIWNLCGLAWTEEKHPCMIDIPARVAVELEKVLKNPDPIFKAAKTISDYCEGTSCNDCPFYIVASQGPTSCSLRESSPALWRTAND